MEISPVSSTAAPLESASAIMPSHMRVIADPPILPSNTTPISAGLPSSSHLSAHAAPSLQPLQTRFYNSPPIYPQPHPQVPSQYSRPAHPPSSAPLSSSSPAQQHPGHLSQPFDMSSGLASQAVLPPHSQPQRHLYDAASPARETSKSQDPAALPSAGHFAYSTPPGSNPLSPFGGQSPRIDTGSLPQGQQPHLAGLQTHLAASLPMPSPVSSSPMAPYPPQTSLNSAPGQHAIYSSAPASAPASTEPSRRSRSFSHQPSPPSSMFQQSMGAPPLDQYSPNSLPPPPSFSNPQFGYPPSVASGAPRVDVLPQRFYPSMASAPPVPSHFPNGGTPMGPPADMETARRSSIHGYPGYSQPVLQSSMQQRSMHPGAQHARAHPQSFPMVSANPENMAYGMHPPADPGPYESYPPHPSHPPPPSGSLVHMTPYSDPIPTPSRTYNLSIPIQLLPKSPHSAAPQLGDDLSSPTSQSPLDPADKSAAAALSSPEAGKSGSGDPRPIKEKRHTCPVCKQMFSRKYNMNQHMFVHGDNRTRDHSCGKCGRSYYRSADLRRHLRSHDAEDPHRIDHGLADASLSDSAIPTHDLPPVPDMARGPASAASAPGSAPYTGPAAWLMPEPGLGERPYSGGLQESYYNPIPPASSHPGLMGSYSAPSQFSYGPYYQPPPVAFHNGIMGSEQGLQPPPPAPPPPHSVPAPALDGLRHPQPATKSLPLGYHPPIKPDGDDYRSVHGNEYQQVFRGDHGSEGGGGGGGSSRRPDLSFHKVIENQS
ncbi:uncharacterized protein BJ171DRAFT_238495 [Polychytrium aggregatum]|uniref:uncharacterized protein n=1 Tax=Polychytrium aggregatum TaxID=110093 RepID=UPI0022FEA743|nr:uncharacterized protein BJ171DRAFT_238495 [Polychytrium aggregatum]KAI9208341.1 hypothetical protein BJ171DRAFT_238495 [Polychytrium aggregatum]